MNSSSIDHFVVDALGLQRIGQAQAADHQVGPRGAAAVELLVDVLALAERVPAGSSVKFGGQMLAMQIGRADLDQLHAQFARQEARQRDFELRVGKEEDPLAGELRAMRGQRLARPLAAPAR